MTDLKADDTVTAWFHETLETLYRVLDVIAADPKLAKQVIEEISYMTRHHGDEDPEIVAMHGETRFALAETIAEAVDGHWQKEMAKEVADISALHQLGRYMLSEVDESSDDEGLYVLISGIAGLIADYLAEHSKLIWTIGATDEVLIGMSIEGDGSAPNLAPGALDRARSAMRNAGWLSWQVKGNSFIYTMTPPKNWRELVKKNEAAIAVAERDAQGGALQ